MPGVVSLEGIRQTANQSVHVGIQIHFSFADCSVPICCASVDSYIDDFPMTLLSTKP